MAAERRARGEAAAVALAVLIGLLLSVAYARRTDGLTPDSYQYLRSGTSLAAGLGYRALDGSAQTLFPPGYPILLGAAGAALGDPVLAGRVVSVAASVASIGLIYLLGRLVFSGAVGAWAALLLALWPLRVQCSVMVLSDSAYLALALGGLVVWLLSESRPWAGLFAGLCLGAAYVTRPEGLLIFLVCVVASVASPGKRVRPWATVGLRAGGLVVGFAVLAAPFMLYLHHQMGGVRLTGKADMNLAVASALSEDVPYQELRALDARAETLIRPATATTAKDHLSRLLSNLREESQVIGDGATAGPFVLAALGLGLAALFGGSRVTRRAGLVVLFIALVLLLATAYFFLEYRYLLFPVALLITVAAGARSLPEAAARRGAAPYAAVATALLALGALQFAGGTALMIARPVGRPMDDITPLVSAMKAERDAPGALLGNFREGRALAWATGRDCLDLAWEPLPRVLHYADYRGVDFLLVEDRDHPDLARLAWEPVTTDRLRPLARVEAGEGEDRRVTQLYRILPPPEQ